MTDPLESDPTTWQCCKCDSLEESDGAEELTWEGVPTYSCPKCWHRMTWACCGGKDHR